MDGLGPLNMDDLRRLRLRRNQWMSVVRSTTQSASDGGSSPDLRSLRLGRGLRVVEETNRDLLRLMHQKSRGENVAGRAVFRAC